MQSPHDRNEVRAFVALELSDPVRVYLDGLISELKAVRADVKWVRASSIHITLKFLGEVPVQIVRDIVDTVSPLVAQQKPMSIRVAGLGAFPGLSKPRVVWAGVHDPEGRLTALAGQIDQALTHLGFAPEKRPFSPHLTLGRVRSPRGGAELNDAIRRNQGNQGPGFVVEHAVLFRSILKPTGAEYHALATFPFA